MPKAKARMTDQQLDELIDQAEARYAHIARSGSLEDVAGALADYVLQEDTSPGQQAAVKLARRARRLRKK